MAGDDCPIGVPVGKIYIEKKILRSSKGIFALPLKGLIYENIRMDLADFNSENPYVVVLQKKCRSLKKKLEKVSQVEQSRLQGKVLDKDQLVLLSSRLDLEKTLAVTEAIKQQMEEIAQVSAPVLLPNLCNSLIGLLINIV